RCFINVWHPEYVEGGDPECPIKMRAGQAPSQGSTALNTRFLSSVAGSSVLSPSSAGSAGLASSNALAIRWDSRRWTM
ncbi:hypothetical protein, partial [Caballeronia sp.]|uniref:hypothetical protein n=1 Tax=Caballeronia sp. TaxID=1931223 RepID=UPI003C6AEC40